MKHLWRRTALMLVVTLGFGLSACASDVTGPDAPNEHQPAYGLLGGLLGGVVGVVDGVIDTVEGVVELLFGAVVRLDPTDETTVVERWVGPRGGVVSGGGVELRIPRGALREYTKVTLVVPAGSYVQAEFLPHGLRFEKPAELLFDMSGTSAARGDEDSLVGTYFTAEITDGVIQADEVFPARLRNGVVRFRIDHFSGYAPARRGYTPAGG